MKAVFERMLNQLRPGQQIEQLYIGENWTISVVRDDAGRQRAGLASTPRADELTKQDSFDYGAHSGLTMDGVKLARLAAQSSRPIEVAVGLATLNALLEPDPALVKEIDALDWLTEHGQQRKIAVIGRFPFVDKLRPVAARLWVFELKPLPGEYSPDQAGAIIPQADVLAITSSTIVSNTLEGILGLARPEALVMLLGPSTPLTSLFFEAGVDLLSGVDVVDIEATIASVVQGVDFHGMRGTRRVTMQKRQGDRLP